MVPSKNLEILISVLFAIRGVLGADSTAVVSATHVVASSTAPDETFDSNGVAETSSAVVETSVANSGDEAPTTASRGDLGTVTIYDTPAYSVAVGCVRECLMQEFEAGVPDGLILAAALGCTSPYYNGCYCTSAVASAATSLLSECIVEACSGTAEIPDAFSIYNNYCTTAGYPGPATNVAQTTNIAKTTATAQNSGQAAPPSTTLVTGAIVYTVSNGGSTLLFTETGVQTVITTPITSSSPSLHSKRKKKVNVGAVVGGVLGGLLLIAILLAVFLIWLPRRQKEMAAVESLPPSGPFVPTQPTAPGAEGSTFVPTGVPVRRGPGRAELSEKGGVSLGEKEVIPDVKEKEEGLGRKEGVEVDGTGLAVGELGGESRYGLRPEELDSEGRYVGELHGDGRQFGGAELEGSEVR
ncbi:hypothetical protein EG329_012124 [Mollisiaceae sp. DMI_Dod_QoI]|nr:hypothetical protein EG329_012124 [Helotiales sp. DMI_Dod_QoI]